MPDVIAMVKANICRALPPQPDDCDPDKDEPLLEEAWPHLQVGGRGGLVGGLFVVQYGCGIIRSIPTDLVVFAGTLSSLRCLQQSFPPVPW